MSCGIEQFPDGTGEKGRKDDEPTDGRVVAPLLKVALDASKRMAAVVGADRQPETAGTQVTVNATSNTVTQTTMVNPVLVASQRFGLDPMALAALGDVAAEAMTDGKRAALEQEA
ncbi:MAG: hypothetical protein EKK55_08475 [Rhodocyclaceae bacterium]|nr:MAG: hypothetical protein EKK55_08475 [Rhodocyclaceae bacterium]